MHFPETELNYLTRSLFQAGAAVAAVTFKGWQDRKWQGSGALFQISVIWKSQRQFVCLNRWLLLRLASVNTIEIINKYFIPRAAYY